MTLVCYDDIYATALPAGADAYLGYVDGHWPDYEAEVQKFTSAHIIGLTVFDVQQGDGCDIESGDLTPQQGAQWLHDAQGRVTRPIGYESVSGMMALYNELTALGLTRDKYRLFSAHYGVGAHICGPNTCKYPGLTIEMDATQWTDVAQGLGGVQIDESWLVDDFFGGAAPSSPPQPVPGGGTQVPPARRNVYTPVAEDGVFGYHTCAALQFVIFNGNTVDVDGYFGPLSKKALQAFLGVTQDGIIGPITVKALQAKVGAVEDGQWGRETTTKLQIALNAGTL